MSGGHCLLVSRGPCRVQKYTVLPTATSDINTRTKYWKSTAPTFNQILSINRSPNHKMAILRVLLPVLLASMAVQAQRPRDDDPEIPAWCALPCNRMLFDVYLPEICPPATPPREHNVPCMCEQLSNRDSSLARLYAGCLRDARCSQYNWNRAWSSQRSNCRDSPAAWEEEDQPVWWLDEPPETVTVTVNSTTTTTGMSSESTTTTGTVVTSEIMETTTTGTVVGSQTSPAEETADADVTEPSTPANTDSVTSEDDESAADRRGMMDASVLMGAILIPLGLLWGGAW